MITFSKVIRKSGSSMKTIEVSKDEKPFGSLWTWFEKGEEHPWHVKPLTREHKFFYGKNGLKMAKEYIKSV